MITLLFVGDGPRDEAMLPPLARTVLGCADGAFAALFRAWRSIRLNQGSGFARKLAFAHDVGRDAGSRGVVAVVDRDTSGGERLKEVRQARDDLAQRAARMPIALGAAIPHGEAWLLDDPVAVRKALGLPRDAGISSPHKAPDPKAELNRLWEASPRCRDNPGEPPAVALRAIAAELRIERCNQRDATGFRAFSEDVVAELGPLSAA